jgi:hypothetical protein
MPAMISLAVCFFMNTLVEVALLGSAEKRIRPGKGNPYTLC